MIGYVTVGTNDLKKAGDFYDKICGEMGMGRFMANDRIIAWGGPGGGAGFGVALPFDGKPMTIGNGVMAAFGAKDKAHVDRIYKLALSLGGLLRRRSRPAQREILRRLFQGSRGQQAQRLRDGLRQVQAVRQAVIASEAKQSSFAPTSESWIASSLRASQ